MRIKKLRTFGVMRDFVVYDNIDDFLSSGRTKDELIYWDYLPRYYLRRTGTGDVAKRLEDLRIVGKMLVTSEGEIIPIIGIKRLISRQHNILVAVFLDTAYGRFELKYNVKCRQMGGKQVQYNHQSLISNIVGCNDFWSGFAMSYPTAWAKCEYDPFKAINWLKTRRIINQEFFERLRQQMITDEGYLKIVEQMIPTAEAKAAIVKCMNQDEDLAVKSKSALGVLNLALEVTKLMEKPFASKNGESKTADAFPTPSSNVPQPFVPVDTKKGNQ